MARYYKIFAADRCARYDRTTRTWPSERNVADVHANSAEEAVRKEQSVQARKGMYDITSIRAE